jgi:hypothetical protein
MSRLLPTVLAATVLLSATAAYAAVTVRYYNKDSVSHTYDAVCSGSKKTVEFGSSRTASVTIQGSGPCVVKTPHGDVSLSGGENIEIKDGKITIK